MNTISPVQHFIEQFSGCAPHASTINPEYLRASMQYKVRTRNVDLGSAGHYMLGDLPSVPMFKEDFVERAVLHVKDCTKVKLSQEEGPTLLYLLATFMEELLEACDNLPIPALTHTPWNQSMRSILSNQNYSSMTSQLSKAGVSFFYILHNDTLGFCVNGTSISEDTATPTGIIAKLLDPVGLSKESIKDACLSIERSVDGSLPASSTVTIQEALRGFRELFAHIDLVSGI